MEGRAVYLIKCKIVVAFDGAAGRLRFEAFSQGQSVGSQVLEFFKREVGLVILSSGRTRLAASHSLWSYACLALSSRMSLTPFSPIHMTIV
jgi:hypothetical protein